MPRKVPLAMDSSRILAVHCAENTMQTIGGARHDNKVNMIRHEAIRSDFYCMTCGMALQEIQVRALIGGTEEDALAMIPTLGQMMWASRKNDSGAPRHARNANRAAVWSNQQFGSRFTKKVTVTFKSDCPL